MNSTVSLFEGLSTSLLAFMRMKRDAVHHSNEPHNIHHNFYDASRKHILSSG